MLLPQLVWAQLIKGELESGSYILAAAPTVRHLGRLRLDNGNKLTVKDAEGHKVKFEPKEVVSFRINQRRYLSIMGIRVQPSSVLVPPDVFVEQIDSGQVILLHFDYSVFVGGAYGGSSVGFYGYLLRHPADDIYIAVENGGFTTKSGTIFRNAVRPFLAGRPDLLQLLTEKKVTMDNLPGVIHALNIGQPYVPPPAPPVPPSHYEIMKQQALAKRAKKAAADSTRR